MVASQLKNLAKTQIMNLNRYNRFNMSIKSSVEFLNQHNPVEARITLQVIYSTYELKLNLIYLLNH